jgi:hypothetical protein
LLALLPLAARAGEETRTLPKGRFGILINNVYATGVDYEFGKDGVKRTVGDTHATSINQQALAAANRNSLGNAIFGAISSSLNQTAEGRAFLQSAAAGTDLGVMKMQVGSTANVATPTIMYGVTNKWSLVMAVPYVKLKTDVQWEYVPGKGNDALDQLSTLANAIGITSIPNRNQFVGLAQQVLADKGYKPPVSREKAFLGDMRVMQLLDLGRIGHFSFGTMNTVGLPTGPKHDPDDILDAGSFGHSFVEQEATAVYRFSRKLQAWASGGVRYNIAEKTKFRVPIDDLDLSPDQAQTETVKRQIGLGTFVEAGARYRPLSRIELRAGVIHRAKAHDEFSGDRGSNYEALERMYPYTPESAYVFKVGLKYDPLSNYRPGSIPLMADVNYEETFAGSNTPALKQIMFSIATFF